MYKTASYCKYYDTGTHAHGLLGSAQPSNAPNMISKNGIGNIVLKDLKINSKTSEILT